MNALEWADDLDVEGGCTNNKIADMLRRQHEAIQQLRRALYFAKDYVLIESATYEISEQALKDTEDLA